jgi:hypothetical protein
MKSRRMTERERGVQKVFVDNCVDTTIFARNNRYVYTAPRNDPSVITNSKRSLTITASSRS